LKQKRRDTQVSRRYPIGEAAGVVS
jgi:hypothetical protein